MNKAVIPEQTDSVVILPPINVSIAAFADLSLDNQSPFRIQSLIIYHTGDSTFYLVHNTCFISQS